MPVFLWQSKWLLISPDRANNPVVFFQLHDLVTKPDSIRHSSVRYGLPEFDRRREVLLHALDCKFIHKSKHSGQLYSLSYVNLFFTSHVLMVCNLFATG